MMKAVASAAHTEYLHTGLVHARSFTIIRGVGREAWEKFCSGHKQSTFTQDFQKVVAFFFFLGSNWCEANLWELATLQLVMLCVSTLMIWTSHSVCELIWSRKHSCGTFRLQQGKSQTCDTFLMGRMCASCSSSHKCMCPLWEQCSFSEKCMQIYTHG
jgi:hypothetical protein